MDYNEAKQATITRAEAIAEIKEHNADLMEFFEEVGDKPEYTGEEVLGWLGY